MSSQTAHKHTNRLIHESSPYLLQHAHNPVDWYSWGPEAFERARSEGKPIFLSVGYSTCYWCHVMERQSFENESIAAEMNRRFVNIKVDREERPDVDQLYMTAVQVLTRHGGWPMSVWLTPDLRPFYGGTYFPPTDAHGRPGFVTVLRGLEDAYKNRRDDVEKSATQLVEILKQIAEPAAADHAIRIDERFIDELIERSVSDYDAHLGGFGSAPKFPRETLLELLLTWSAGTDAKTASGSDQSQIANRKSKIRDMLRRTLDAMANGGIRDQLGGGFHRYSTDARWLVPHFEIMLYDNAMLAWCYVEAHRQFGEARYAEVARGIFDFVLREMTSPQGGFYTALDAEVDGQEGQNYLWTADQVRRELTDEPDKGVGAPFSDADAELFLRVYGLDKGANFADPHHGSGRPDKNILFLAEPAAEQQHAERLRRMRSHVLAARRQRKQPLLDTKVITSWNALMIRAMAHGGKVLNERRYIDAARRAAGFLLQHHRSADGGLYRTSRFDGKEDDSREEAKPSTTSDADRSSLASSRESARIAKYPGFLDDYAFLIHALLALHDADADASWRDQASALSDLMVKKFGDSSGSRGFFFTDESATDLIVRQKTASDSPLPSGNAVTAMSLLRLGRDDAARGTLVTFAQQLEHNAEGMSSMVQAAIEYVRAREPIGIEPSADGKRAAAADRPLSPQELAAGVVTLRAQWIDDRQLQIDVQVLPGFHINAHDAGGGLVPTQVLVARDLADRVESIGYPPGQEQTFAYADQPVPVYAGQTSFTVRFNRSMTAEPAPRIALQYQACDDSACLPPVTRPIDVPRIGDAQRA